MGRDGDGDGNAAVSQRISDALFGRGPFLGSRTSIIMYHSVSPEADGYSITPAAFRGHLLLLKERYPIVALKDVSDHFTADPSIKVVLTFDDAFVDFIEHAYPILAELSMPATLFVPTGFVGGYNLWDLHNKDVIRRRVMDTGAIREVCTGGLVDLGSHTVDHVSMRGLSQSDMRFQANASKEWLEDTFGNRITTFSYPYGQRDHFSARSLKVLAESGYDTAVTTCWGTRNSSRNVLTLRRIFFRENDDSDVVRAKIEGQYDWMALKERAGFLVRSGLRAFR